MGAQHNNRGTPRNVTGRKGEEDELLKMGKKGKNKEHSDLANDYDRYRKKKGRGGQGENNNKGSGEKYRCFKIGT